MGGAFSMSESRFITVIVATYRRPEWLLRCLRSLAEAVPPACGFEVVVVDDGGGLPKDMGISFPGRALKWTSLERNGGQTRAQIKGIELARGSILALLDDDATVDPNWLIAIESHFLRHPEIRAFLGRILPIDESHILVRMRQRVYERRHRSYLDPAFREKLCRDLGLDVPSCGAFVSDHLSGGNSAIQKQTLKEVGGLCADVPYGADDNLARRLMEAGYAIGYNPDMIILHQHNESWRRLISHAFSVGRGREASRVAEGGRRGLREAFAILGAILKLPFAIRSFPEILEADRNKIKIYLVYTLHETLVEAGRFWRFLFGPRACDPEAEGCSDEKETAACGNLGKRE